MNTNDRQSTLFAHVILTPDTFRGAVSGVPLEIPLGIPAGSLLLEAPAQLDVQVAFDSATSDTLEAGLVADPDGWLTTATGLLQAVAVVPITIAAGTKTPDGQGAVMTYTGTGVTMAGKGRAILTFGYLVPGRATETQTA